MARSRRATVRRASVFFGFSFLWTAAINVLPQAYLLRVAPERKGLLLAGVLLIGTLSAWLGVELSRRRHARGLQLTPTSLLAATLVHALALLAVVAASAPLWAYCAAFVVFRGASNWLFNLGDGALVRAAGPDVQTHASASTGFQVLGRLDGLGEGAAKAGGEKRDRCGGEKGAAVKADLHVRFPDVLPVRSRQAGAAALPRCNSRRPPDEPYDQQQDHGTDDGGDDRPDDTAPERNAECRKEEAGDVGTDDADDCAHGWPTPVPRFRPVTTRPSPRPSSSRT